jgi:hypothetical protein
MLVGRKSWGQTLESLAGECLVLDVMENHSRVLSRRKDNAPCILEVNDGVMCEK